MLSQRATHLRPTHNDAGERSLQIVSDEVRVRVDRGVQSLETLPLDSGSFATGAHVAFLSGRDEDWRDGDYIDVDGRRFEILATSSVMRNKGVIEATVVEKQLPEPLA